MNSLAIVWTYAINRWRIAAFMIVQDMSMGLLYIVSKRDRALFSAPTATAVTRHLKGKGFHLRRRATAE